MIKYYYFFKYSMDSIVSDNNRYFDLGFCFGNTFKYSPKQCLIID